ncbi:MAG TPA: DinB family protein [Nocardioidaceae bacterium]|nr:DinB family protein [Nocardioidaceae bacterium]
MNDFIDKDLSDSQFRDVDLSGASFRSVNLADARFHAANLYRAVIRGTCLIDVQIDAEIENLTINGVDVGPLIEAERDRQDPERILMRPSDPAGFGTAWDVVERRWDETVEHARALPPEQLHVSVDGEWSFIETLRHLAFATDSWIRRAIHRDPTPWHPLDLPWDEMPDMPGVPRDRSVRPSLDEALELRRDRMASVRAFVDQLTDAELNSTTEPVDAPGWPDPIGYPVRECLLIVLNEEWEHRRFAERDLTILESHA